MSSCSCVSDYCYKCRLVAPFYHHMIPFWCVEVGPNESSGDIPMQLHSAKERTPPISSGLVGRFLGSAIWLLLHLFWQFCNVARQSATRCLCNHVIKHTVCLQFYCAKHTYRLTNSSDLLQQTQLQCKTADKRDCLKLQHSLLSGFQSVSQVLHLLARLRLSFIFGCHTWKHASPEAPQQRCCLETNWLEHAKRKKKKEANYSDQTDMKRVLKCLFDLISLLSAFSFLVAYSL